MIISHTVNQGLGRPPNNNYSLVGLPRFASPKPFPEIKKTNPKGCGRIQDILVGGWTNPFETYVRQIGSFPQVREKIRNYLKPPPVYFYCIEENPRSFQEGMWFQSHQPNNQAIKVAIIVDSSPIESRYGFRFFIGFSYTKYSKSSTWYNFPRLNDGEQLVR